MLLEKRVKQKGVPFTVLTKLHHMSSSGAVKVFYLELIHRGMVVSSHEQVNNGK